MSTTEALQSAARQDKLLPGAIENLTAWLDSGVLPAWATQSIDELVGQQAWEELNNRFYQYLAFGTGGMRGRTIGGVVTDAERGGAREGETPTHAAVGTAVLNDFNVVRATLGLFRYAQRFLRETTGYDEVPRLVIAHDVRHFSRHFTELAASVWNAQGGTAFIFDGPRSTPQLSFAVRDLCATAGIVITASHNPPHDNGYKVYFADGAQVVYPHAEGIITEVYRTELSAVAPFLKVNLDGVITLGPNADERYQQILQESILDRDVFTQSRPKVVFSPIHGTGAVASVPAMKSLGIDVITVDEQMVPDGRFPTVKSPNPENAEALAMGLDLADKTGADVLLATDPDADRMGVAVRNDEGKLQLLTGNMIGSLLAAYRVTRMKELGWLPRTGTKRAALIKTFVTTPLQAAIGEQHGLKVIDTLTGFKWIGEKLKIYEDELTQALREQDGLALAYDATTPARRRELLLQHSTYYVFGGEESYGYLAGDRARDKDANAAVLMFCEMVAALGARGKTVTAYLDELYLEYGYFLEDLVNIYYEGASGAKRIKNILDSYRDDTPQQLGDLRVTAFQDFGRETFHDADGKEIPKQDFYLLQLDNGYRFAVRGSGTEPKIKFYLFAREDVAEPVRLTAAKEKARQTLDALAKAIRDDAEARADKG